MNRNNEPSATGSSFPPAQADGSGVQADGVSAECSKLMTHLMAGSGLVAVSRRFFVGLTLTLFLGTGGLMMLLTQIDLESWLLVDRIALKAGGTVISLDEFQQIKAQGAPETTSLTHQAYARELLETVLLAEAGRQLGLDREPDFLRRIREIDQLISQTTGPIDLTRTVFLMEELAQRTRDHIAASSDPQQTQQQAIDRWLHTLRTTIPWRLHPSLR